MAIAGGCLCRAVRYEVRAEAPLAARDCWRRGCQYLGCGTGAVSALFRKEDVTVSGPPHRRFCSQCGTQIFSEAEERPAATFIRAGTLDNPDLAAPTAIIWPQSAPKWACFDPNLPRIEGQPPAPKVSQRRLERFAFRGREALAVTSLLTIRNLCYGLHLLELDSARSRRPDEKMECASI